MYNLVQDSITASPTDSDDDDGKDTVEANEDHDQDIYTENVHAKTEDAGDPFPKTELVAGETEPDPEEATATAGDDANAGDLEDENVKQFTVSDVFAGFSRLGLGGLLSLARNVVINLEPVMLNLFSFLF